MQSAFSRPVFRFGRTTGVTCLLAGLLLTPTLAVAGNIEEGKRLAFDRKLGNCLACHVIEGGESPGDIAPPLVGMTARFPDKQALREKIWDATVSSPDSIMIPFGKHKVLTEEEIDQVVEFVMSL